MLRPALQWMLALAGSKALCDAMTWHYVMPCSAAAARTSKAPSAAAAAQTCDSSSSLYFLMASPVPLDDLLLMHHTATMWALITLVHASIMDQQWSGC
jgi:hypothetical protein